MPPRHTTEEHAIFAGTIGSLYAILGLLCVRVYRDHRKKVLSAAEAERAREAAAARARSDAAFATEVEAGRTGAASASPPPVAVADVGANQPTWLDPSLDPNQSQSD